jgi:NAD(P) transhydrogenase subunit alpha
MTDVLFIFGLFCFTFGISFALISRVPNRLHTPLMSMTNAISGISILGAFLLFAQPASAGNTTLGFIAVTAAAFNVAGGFVITHRMVAMFRRHGHDSGKGSELRQDDR